MEIAAVKLAKEKIDKHQANVIAKSLWNQRSRDIRDVIKVARLTSSIEEIPFVLRMSSKKDNFAKSNIN